MIRQRLTERRTKNKLIYNIAILNKTIVLTSAYTHIINYVYLQDSSKCSTTLAFRTKRMSISQFNKFVS